MPTFKIGPIFPPFVRNLNTTKLNKAEKGILRIKMRRLRSKIYDAIKNSGLYELVDVIDVNELGRLGFFFWGFWRQSYNGNRMSVFAQKIGTYSCLS